MATEPKTLQDAILYFADADNCLNYLLARRWSKGVTCPRCGSAEVGFVASRRIWQCKTRHDHAQFSIKTGTIFEDSPISLDKWLLAMWMMANCKNGVSSYEISRATGISQKSTWFMLQRIRLAMQGEDGGKLGGEVEVDETFIGGKARNMHAATDGILCSKVDGRGAKSVLRPDRADLRVCVRPRTMACHPGTDRAKRGGGMLLSAHPRYYPRYDPRHPAYHAFPSRLRPRPSRCHTSLRSPEAPSGSP